MSKKVKKPLASSSKPKFPYTTTPSALRKFLQEVPKRPKPGKVDFPLLQTWGLKDSNARTIIGVIRELGLIDSSSIPTDNYINFMRNETGAASLSVRIKETYAKLFETNLEPYKDSQENLKNFFNIHSGGGEKAIQLQVQTFKTLCEYADFSSTIIESNAPPSNSPRVSAPVPVQQNGVQIHINLHIHLPENKSRADYEESFKDIAKNIIDK